MQGLKKVSLRIAVVTADGKAPEPKRLEFLKPIFKADDTLVPSSAKGLSTGKFDAGLFLGVCGSTPVSETAARVKLPVMAVEPYMGFHPYHAAFYRDLEARKGIILPALNPEEIADSIQAVRARKSLAGTKLLVVDMHTNDFRAKEVRAFTKGCRKHLGVEIIRRPASEMKSMASKYSDAQADKILDGWYKSVLEGSGEMNEKYMRQVAKLYLAERALLDETKALGITVEDIGAFLLSKPSEVMPNITYGPLVCEGFLAAEEGDIEVLASELLLMAGLGTAATMSNIYLGFRNRFRDLGDHTKYVPEMELEDVRQSMSDNHVTAAHFSASGVLPPSMMEEKRYKVMETLPAWPGQGMIMSTPKLGQVILARLTADASGIHTVPGEADTRLKGNQYGWYRGSWYIRIPSVMDFIGRCLYQHYAICPENRRFGVLQILTKNLLGLAER